MRYAHKSVFYFILSGIILLNAVSSSKAEESAEEPSFYDMLVGNTVYAQSTQDNNSIEYHAPDGRVLGYNWDDVKNIRSCWRMVEQDIVCYYYEYSENDDKTKSMSKNESCWKYVHSGSNRFTGKSTTNSTRLVARIVKGNPENLTDFGVKWTCGQQIIASMN